MANHNPPLTAVLLISLALSFFLAAASESATAADENQRQREQHGPYTPYRGREMDECQLSRLNSLEPTNRIQCEAGVIESWDANEDEFRCAGVAVVRHVIEPNGLLLPSFSNAPQLVYIVQGRGIQGLILPGCPETFQSSQSPFGGSGEYGGREEFGERGGQRGRWFQDQHQKIRHFRQGDVLVLPNGAAHWVYNDGDRPLVAIVLLDVTNNLNQLDINPRRFYLAGNPEDEHQTQFEQRGRHSQRQQPFTRRGGQGGGPGGACNNIFCGFNAEFLAEAFNVDMETARRLQSEGDNRNNIVRVEGGLQVLRPPRRESEWEREGQRGPSQRRYQPGQSRRESQRRFRPIGPEWEREGQTEWERERPYGPRRETGWEREREEFGPRRGRETEWERERPYGPGRGRETEWEREREQYGPYGPRRRAGGRGRETEWERERERYQRPGGREGGCDNEGGCGNDGAMENGLEETLCTMRLRENIGDPDRADVYTPQAGRISSLNSHNLPILYWLQLSAEHGLLHNGGLMVPHWNMNAHSIIYAIRGRARIQVVDNNGQAVFDEELQEGRILVVPQNFAVVKRAENEEFEWVSFKTSDNAMINPLAGRTSVIRALPDEVIANAYQISREDAQRLKYSRKETTLFLARRGGSMIQRRAAAA